MGMLNTLGPPEGGAEGATGVVEDVDDGPRPRCLSIRLVTSFSAIFRPVIEREDNIAMGLD